jgi:alanyl aminopeptidase
VVFALAGCGGAGEQVRPTPAPAACVPVPRADGAAPPTGPLPDGVRPTRYAISLDVDPRAARFEGQVVISLSLDRPTPRVWLHGRGLDVRSVRGAASDGLVQDGEYREVDATGVARIDFPCPMPPGEVQLTVVYSAPFLEQGDGLFRVVVGDDRYAFTQLEPLSARAVMPCFDEPRFKVPMHVDVVTHGGDLAFGNAPVVGDVTTRDGARHFAFAPTKPLPTYLFALAVGPLDVVDAPPLPANDVRAEAIPLRGIAVRGRGARLRHALSRVPAIVAVLERYFALPYPYEKLDLVAIRDFPGAMENAGLLTFDEWLLFYDEDASEEQRRAGENVLAHELAHQWFGNLVTAPWWDELWLNEAFATWMATRVVAETAPDLGAEASRIEEWQEAAAADALATARRVRQPIETHHDVHSAFDGITYAKGASVLAMFERYAGADAFRDGVRRYLARRAHGTGSTADLLAAISEASGRDVATPLRSFLDRPGMPRIAFGLVCEGGDARLTLAQERALPVGSRAERVAVWTVPVCVRYAPAPSGGPGAAAPAAREACTLLDGREGVLALEGGCPAWVSPNAGGVGYYQAVLDRPLRDRLAAPGVLSALPARERHAIAAGLVDGFHAGTVPGGEALDALLRSADDPERSVALAALPLLAFAREHVLDDASVARLEAAVRRAYGPVAARLGVEPRAGESGETRLLRAELLRALAFLGRDPQVRARFGALGRRALALEVGAGQAAPGARGRARGGQGGGGQGGGGQGGDGRAEGPGAGGTGPAAAPAADGNPTGTAPGPAPALRTDGVPADLLELALAVAVAAGGGPAFERARELLFVTDDPAARDALLGALAAATEPARAEAARALALDPRVAPNETRAILRAQLRGRATREAALGWLERHLDALARRVPEFVLGRLPLLGAGLCDADARERLNALFAPRAPRLPGGPRALAEALELIDLCIARRGAQGDALRARFSR